MNSTKVYIWKLASFLVSNNTVMSGNELANHLNRNEISTSYDSKYKGGRGIFTLIRETYNSLDELGLENEAIVIADAFVDKHGDPAYE